MSFLKTLFQKLPVPSTNYLWRPFPVSPYSLLKSPEPVIWDIGSLDARGRYSFGAPPPGAKLYCLDIRPGPGVDIVADAHDLHMVGDNTVDCVAAVGMLLHCHTPSQVISEFYRVLKPGGILYVSAPFVFTQAEPPDDYFHFSTKGLEVVCQRFEKVDSGYSRGPAATMCHLIIEFLAILFCFGSQALYRLGFFLFSWLFFWIKYLDAIVGGYKQSGSLYSGAYFIGRKPGQR